MRGVLDVPGHALSTEVRLRLEDGHGLRGLCQGQTMSDMRRGCPLRQGHQSMAPPEPLNRPPTGSLPLVVSLYVPRTPGRMALAWRQHRLFTGCREAIGRAPWPTALVPQRVTERTARPSPELSTIP